LEGITVATPTSEEQANAVQQAALADWQSGHIGNEFYDKVPERQISDRDVERVLKSKSSGVWQYRHEKNQLRYGCWHPATEIFVAWQPAEEELQSEIKSAFIVHFIDRYVAGKDEVVCLRPPKGEQK
jgi:hypothetical protein